MAGGAVLGSAVLELSADDNKLKSGLQSARNSADGFFSGMLKGAAGVAAGILGAQGISAAIGFVKDSVFGLAAGFEQQMNVLQAVSGATGNDMTALGAKAKALGADITLPGTSAKDAAEAMTELGKAGLSINDILGASQGVLQLSAAGQLSNAQAAEIASNALNTFGLEGSEANRIADLLAASSNASSVSVQDVSESLKHAGAAFATAGVPIEDVVTSIGQLGNAGIKGEMAGTGLRAMMLSLTAPTDGARAVMDDLGISIFDAAGKMKPWPQITKELIGSMAGLTDEQRSFAMATMFTNVGMGTANALILQGAEAQDKMAEAVRKEGAASDLAASYNKGLKGAMDGIKSAVETLQITIGGLLLPKLADMARGFAGAVGQIEPLAHLFMLGFNGGEIGGEFTQIERAVFRAGQVFRDDILPPARAFSDWITNVAMPALADFAQHDVWPKIETVARIFRDDLAPAAKDFASVIWPKLEDVFGWLADHKEVIVAAVAAFIALKTALLVGGMIQAAVGLGIAFVTMAGQVGILNAAMIVLNLTMLTNPFVLVAIAIAALVAAGIILYKNWDTIKEKTQQLWDKIQGFADKFGEWIENHKLLAAGILLLTGPIGLVIGAIVLLIKHWDDVKAAAIAVKDEVIASFTHLWSEVVRLFNAIKDEVTASWNHLKEEVVRISNAVKDEVVISFNNMRDTIGGVLDNIRDWVVEKFNAAKDGAVSAATAVKDEVVTSFNNMKDNVSEAVQALYDAATGKFGELVTWVEGLPQKILDGLGDLLGLLTQKGTDLIQGLWDAVSTRAATFITDLMTWVTGIPGAIGEMGMLMWSVGKSIIEGLWTGATNYIGTFIINLKNWVTSLPGQALSWLKGGSPALVFVPIGESIPQGIALGIDREAPTTIDAMNGLLKGLVSAWQVTQIQIEQLDDQINNALLAGNQSLADSLGAKQSVLLTNRDQIVAALSDMGLAIGNVSHGMVEVVSTSMQTVSGSIEAAVPRVWATIQQLQEMWTTFVASGQYDTERYADYFENMTKSMEQLSSGVRGVIAEDFSFINGVMFESGESAQGLADKYLFIQQKIVDGQGRYTAEMIAGWQRLGAETLAQLEQMGYNTQQLTGIVQTFDEGLGQISEATLNTFRLGAKSLEDWVANVKAAGGNVYSVMTEQASATLNGVAIAYHKGFDTLTKAIAGYFDGILETGLDWNNDMITMLPPGAQKAAREIGEKFALGLEDAHPEVLDIMAQYIDTVVATGETINDVLSALPPEYRAIAIDMGMAIANGLASQQGAIIGSMVKITDAMIAEASRAKAAVDATYAAAMAQAQRIQAATTGPQTPGAAITPTASAGATVSQPAAPRVSAPAYAAPSGTHGVVTDAQKDYINQMNAMYPTMGTGGYVKPRRGGTVVRLAERGEGEWVTPDSKRGGGNTYHIDFAGAYFLGSPEEFKQAMRDVISEQNRKYRRAAQMNGAPL